MTDLYGAIDLGGTKVRALVADLDGNVCGEEMHPTEADRGQDSVIDRMIETLRSAAGQAQVRAEDLRAVGVASPGALDLVRGLVFEAAQLPGWDGVPLARIIGDRLGVPALLENDANAAALGENRFGAGRGTRQMIFLTISTGVGGGIIIDGKVYHGATGAAGELGHVVLNVDGPRCLCNARGCLEAYASGTGIAWRARELVERGEAPGLARVVEEGSELGADEVAGTARAGDRDALRLFDEAGFYLGVALANFINIFNPEAIVIGGSLRKLGERYLGPAAEVVHREALRQPYADVHIVEAELGDDAPAIGAALLAAESMTD